MTVKLMDRTKEKLELAKELGMEGYVSLVEGKLKRNEVIEELMLMNFKPTSVAEVERKLIKRVFNKAKLLEELSNNGVGILMLSALITCAALVVGVGIEAICHKHSLVILGISSIMGFLSAPLILFFDNLTVCSVSHDPLEMWSEEIPYGALLAVAEAKLKGFSNFTIFYPVFDYTRIKDDPIIVGKKDSVLVEIFHWDDGKIYE